MAKTTEKKKTKKMEVELSAELIAAVIAALAEKAEAVAGVLVEESDDEEATESDDEEDTEAEESDDEEKDEEEGDEEKDEDSDEDTEEMELPPLVKINKMKLPELKKLAKKVGVKDTDRDQAELRQLLATVAAIGDKEFDDLDDDAVQELAEALDLEVDKKPAKTLETLKDYFSVSEEEEGDEEEASDDEEKDEEESDDEEEEKPKKKKKPSKDEDEESDDEEGDDEESDEKEEDDEESDDEESDTEVDPAEVVKEHGKFPKPEIMQKRLAAFNKAAGKKAIKVGKDVKASYAKLLENLVDDEGNLAAWGDAYIKDEEGYCAGLPLLDAKIKGEKRQVGKCAATGKMFVFNDDEEFEAVEE